ncbi:MAG: hypothetical protein K2X47_11575, partial [Bdellovibrionales bacterium]|nr:hypothetical protein [Bdellovibrionales bacterium]
MTNDWKNQSKNKEAHYEDKIVLIGRRYENKNQKKSKTQKTPLGWDSVESRPLPRSSQFGKLHLKGTEAMSLRTWSSAVGSSPP